MAQFDDNMETDALYFMEAYELSKTSWDSPSELMAELLSSTQGCISYPHLLSIFQLLSYIRCDSETRSVA